jgi:hypothetical protein
VEQLRELVRFQTLQDKKAELMRSRDELPRRIAEIEHEYAFAESEFAAKKAELDHYTKMNRTLEKEVAELEVKIGKSRQRMNEVKTNKEYAAILKEIDDIKAEVRGKEDRILESMEHVEGLGREVRRLDKEMAERKRRTEEEKARLIEESERVAGKLEQLEAVQQKVRARLDAEILRRCSFLIEKKGGIAVARVENGVCQICHLNIPPQKFIELQRDETIHQCPHCHRFVYWPGHDAYSVFEEDLE